MAESSAKNLKGHTLFCGNTSHGTLPQYMELSPGNGPRNLSKQKCRSDMRATDNGDHQPNPHNRCHDIADYTKRLQTDESQYHTLLRYEQTGGHQQGRNDQRETDAVGTLIQHISQIVQMLVLNPHLELASPEFIDNGN